MAPSKSLALLALALLALGASAQPLLARDESSAHSLVAGEREAGDYLVREVRIVEDIEPLEGYPMRLRRGFKVSPYEVITQVVVVDKSADGSGPDMSIIAGGPGSVHVSLLFQTEKYHGIDVHIQIYAKRVSESH